MIFREREGERGGERQRGGAAPLTLRGVSISGACSGGIIGRRALLMKNVNLKPTQFRISGKRNEVAHLWGATNGQWGRSHGRSQPPLAGNRNFEPSPPSLIPSPKTHTHTGPKQFLLLYAALFAVLAVSLLFVFPLIRLMHGAWSDATSCHLSNPSSNPSWLLFSFTLHTDELFHVSLLAGFSAVMSPNTISPLL